MKLPFLYNISWNKRPVRDHNFFFFFKKQLSISIINNLISGRKNTEKGVNILKFYHCNLFLVNRLFPKELLCDPNILFLYHLQICLKIEMWSDSPLRTDFVYFAFCYLYHVCVVQENILSLQFWLELDPKKTIWKKFLSASQKTVSFFHFTDSTLKNLFFKMSAHESST